MRIEVFPTLLYCYQLENQNQIKEKVENYYDKHKDESSTPNEWNCDLFTSYGTNTFPIQECLDAFNPILEEFQKETKLFGKIVLTDMWLNVYQKQNWQEKHVHSPGQWSSVYYVHFDPNEHRATKFHNPIETLLASNGIKENCVSPTVKEGDMVIFPAWLEHAAPMNKSSKLRSTISFNFFIERN